LQLFLVRQRTRAGDSRGGVPGCSCLSTETLTMYTPNFCTECGERITYTRWHFWTSRRFCPLCAPRFRNARILLPILASVTLFTLGLGAGRALRPAPPPLIIERRQPSAPSTQTAQLQSPSANTNTGNSSAQAKPQPNAGDAIPERPADSPDIVSICGALTKKGTPCQRRVHGTGRCWQHKGMPAIIPLEERIVKRK
jgi:hypothetical protein